MPTPVGHRGLLQAREQGGARLRGGPEQQDPCHPAAAFCKPENKVALGFVEGLNNNIRVIQRRAYGLRDEEYLRLKILTCMLPQM